MPTDEELTHIWIDDGWKAAEFTFEEFKQYYIINIQDHLDHMREPIRRPDHGRRLRK